VRSGKVRDIYEVDADHLLIVASDRISAFDCILPNPIPYKGEVLTQISKFWFARFASVVDNHLVLSGEKKESTMVIDRTALAKAAYVDGDYGDANAGSQGALRR